MESWIRKVNDEHDAIWSGLTLIVRHITYFLMASGALLVVINEKTRCSHNEWPMYDW